MRTAIAALDRALPQRYRYAHSIRKRRATFWFTGSRSWSFLAFSVVAVVFLSVPSENRYPAALVGAFTFFLVQLVLPSCRPVSGKLLCPWNWALFIFFLQLVLLPLSVLLFGPSQGVLPFLPSDRAINLAVLINTAAFVTFCSVYHYLARRPELARPSNALGQGSRAVGAAPSLAFIALNGVIGLIGFFLAFGALGKLKEYFTDPSGYLSQIADISDRLELAAGQFLRPFLGICIVMLWCRWLDRKRSHKTKRFSSLVTALAILAVCLSNATFNYNRGSIVVPLVAMLAVLVSGPSRIPRRTIISAGAIVLVVLLLVPFYGAYRSSNFTGKELFNDPSVRDLLADKVELTEMFQVYGGAPQFLGFFLETGRWGAKPQWGKVLVASSLAPVPILGKPFRENSGTAIYNRLIYGMLDVEDQIAPFQGEAFLDFHLAGVLAGFCILGWSAFKLQAAFTRSQSFFEIFLWQYFSVWAFFLIFGSLSVVSQIFIYFCWPFYLYFIYRRVYSRLLDRGHAINDTLADADEAGPRRSTAPTEDGATERQKGI
jgi:hypothetical protein